MKEKNWWEKDYGRYQWLLLNQYQGSASGEQFASLGYEDLFIGFPETQKLQI